MTRPPALAGTLGLKDGFMRVRVQDAANGTLQLTWIEGKSTPELKTVSVQLRKTGDWTFLDIRANQMDDKKDDDPRKNYFMWTLIKRDEEFVIAWAPDAKSFKKLVEDGVWPGEIVKGDVVLDALDNEKMPDLKEHEACSLFNWGDPLVFFRVSSDTQRWLA